MNPRVLFAVSLTTAGILAAGCGTIPPAVYTITQVPAVVDTGETVAQVASATPLPTETPVPTSTPAPTSTPTLEPTIEPTEAAAEVAADGAIGGPDYGANDPIKFTVDNFGDAARGETLFNQTLNIDGAEWACSTCHNVVGDEMKIGPSLYLVGERAPDRVPGEGPYTYLYNSIHASQAYIVPGYEAGAQMPVYENVLTASQIYDLIAYLLTLQ